MLVITVLFNLAVNSTYSIQFKKGQFKLGGSYYFNGYRSGDHCFFISAKKQIKLINTKYPKTTNAKTANIVLITVSGKQLY